MCWNTTSHNIIFWHLIFSVLFIFYLTMTIQRATEYIYIYLGNLRHNHLWGIPNQSNLKFLCHNSTSQEFKTLKKKSLYSVSLKCIECKNVTSKRKKIYFRGRSFPPISYKCTGVFQWIFFLIKFLRIKKTDLQLMDYCWVMHIKIYLFFRNQSLNNM